MGPPTIGKYRTSRVAEAGLLFVLDGRVGAGEVEGLVGEGLLAVGRAGLGVGDGGVAAGVLHRGVEAGGDLLLEGVLEAGALAVELAAEVGEALGVAPSAAVVVELVADCRCRCRLAASCRSLRRGARTRRATAISRGDAFAVLQGRALLGRLRVG